LPRVGISYYAHVSLPRLEAEEKKKGRILNCLMHQTLCYKLELENYSLEKYTGLSMLNSMNYKEINGASK
jgi:hypothetical protein